MPPLTARSWNNCAAAAEVPAPNAAAAIERERKKEKSEPAAAAAEKWEQPCKKEGGRGKSFFPFFLFPFQNLRERERGLLLPSFLIFPPSFALKRVERERERKKERVENM